MKKKCYILDMFPYPSGEGLHVGHPKGYIATDIYSRYKKMQDYEVIHPMGWDAFGLPAEQYAIKNKVHPKIAVEKNIANFKAQLEKINLDYDWDREISTTDPKFYKWTQWIFKQLYKKGLAYESFEPINWCPSCKTGLANEDLEGNACERCGTAVEKKPLRQWNLAITKYADRLIDDLDTLVDWPEHVKTAQRNWIGRSEGSEIEFRVITQDPLPTSPSKVGVTQGLSPSPSPRERGGTQNSEDTPKYLTADIKKYESLKIKALEMRKSPTKAEEILWEILTEEFKEYHFRRQHIVDNFIVDFISLNSCLVIEVDGDIHDLQKSRDEERTKIINSHNFQVIRFSNDDVINNLEKVKIEIRNALEFSGSPLLRRGAGGEALSAEGVVREASSKEIYSFKIFTTRADTLFGCTYTVLAPEHGLVKEWIDRGLIKNVDEVQKYIDQVKDKTDIERGAEGKEKTGVRLDGVMAINPADKKEVPIYIADYVLASYGTGAIMAVPAHDERDYEFAMKYEIKMREVVQDNKLFNSYEFDGMSSEEARVKITEAVGGKIVKKYKLREWVFARQRYWGEPFPIVYESAPSLPEGVGGRSVLRKSYIVADSELPVLLPDVESYEPTGTGESPLADIKSFTDVYGYINSDGEFESVKNISSIEEAKIKSKEINKEIKLFRRETNTMPQWAGSSWYWLRFLDPHNDNFLIDKDIEKAWPQVDVYVGGDHATRHLIYARFWHKFLYDIGVVSHIEPFKRLEFLGFILAPDGSKMSKSKGNVINPDTVIDEYGSDTFRLYEMFMAPFEATAVWNTNSIKGVKRFLERVERMRVEVTQGLSPSPSPQERGDIQTTLHQTIKKIGEDIENFKFNTAISQLMICLNAFEEYGVNKDDFTTFMKLLTPFAPTLCANYLKSEWPTYDESKLVGDTVTIAIQIDGKMRGTFETKLNTENEVIINIIKENEAYKKYVVDNEGKSVDPKKIIIVKNKIVNVVI